MNLSALCFGNEKRSVGSSQMLHMTDGHPAGTEKSQKAGCLHGCFLRVIQGISAPGKIIILDIDEKESGVHDDRSFL
jgi:hypothetical protein